MPPRGPALDTNRARSKDLLSLAGLKYLLPTPEPAPSQPFKLRGADISTQLAGFADLPVVSLGCAPGTSCELLAIIGGGHAGSSFKDLLGLGMLVLAREAGVLRPGQPVIESTSGSMGIALAWAGRSLGHPITLVSDPNIPRLTLEKIRTLGAELVTVETPHNTGGWQQAREERVLDLMDARAAFYCVDQNDSPLNPAVYRRWLVPALARKVQPKEVTGAVFSVGSGGHFSAIAGWLKETNARCQTFAADRPGSVTFGKPKRGFSRIRGLGNSNRVPTVIQTSLSLVDGVITVDEDAALLGCRALLREHGLFMGGSSGAAYAAALEVARRVEHGSVLTLFPDRGEVYGELFDETIWNELWQRRHPE